MTPASVTNVGGSQAHLNMQPFLTLSFCIALAGHLPEPDLRRFDMAQPYVGEIRMFAGNFAPAGWMFCEGQLLPISRKRDPVSTDRHDLRRRRRVHLCAARPAGRIPHSSGQRLHPGRDRRCGGDHADGEADPCALPSLPGPPEHWRQATVPTGNAVGASPVATIFPTAPISRRDSAARRRRPGRRKPAAHELSALPVRRLHHLAVRDLPVSPT